MPLTQVPPALLTSTTGTGSTVVLSASPTFTGTVTTPGVTFSDASSQTAAASPYVLKNRIINGDMVISQRNGTSSITPSAVGGGYCLDRWAYYTAASSKYSIQQNAGSVTPPAGFTNYLGITSLAATTLGSTDTYSIRQFIEGYNVADLDFGKSTAKTITISFWVRSSLTGAFGALFWDGSAGTSMYPFSYTINSANTWEQKTVTIAGRTSGTWETNNNAGASVQFMLGTGSSYQGTGNVWNSGTTLVPTGSTNVVGTNGATWYITGVQLEIGSSATPFERRLYNQELANCQRYYQTLTMVSGYTGPSNIGIQCSVPFNQMRAAPTFSQSGVFRFDDAAAGYTQSSVGVSTDTVTNSGALLNFSNITVGGNFRPYGKNNSATLNLSAEL